MHEEIGFRCPGKVRYVSLRKQETTKTFLYDRSARSDFRAGILRTVTLYSFSRHYALLTTLLTAISLFSLSNHDLFGPLFTSSFYLEHNSKEMQSASLKPNSDIQKHYSLNNGIIPFANNFSANYYQARKQNAF